MIRRILISLGAAFLAAMIAYLAIIVLAPTMYVEKAFNFLAAAFIGTGGVTWLVLMRRRG
jgi:hypothetical protein